MNAYPPEPWPPNKRVDFLICGAQKSGTSAIDLHMRDHPSICMGEHKELHYFDSDHFFSDHRRTYDLYHQHFRPPNARSLIGEATPIYMYWKTAPKRIYDYNSRIKIIIILRNPIDRAYSHWNMIRHRGDEKLSFAEALHAEEQRLTQAFPLQSRSYSYASRGFYTEQLYRIWSFFSRDQVLVLQYDLLRDKPFTAMNTICDFLGISHFRKLKEYRARAYPYPGEMDHSSRSYLFSLFESEIRRLEKELGWDCSNWLD